jgi:glycosyltransferase involved in cell wall biosynthesis
VDPTSPVPHPLRILHVTAPGVAGGLESVVQQLSAGLCARGHEVWLACTVVPGAPEPPLAIRARGAGVQAVTLHLPGRGYVAEFGALRRLMASAGIQVVHTHGYRSDVVGGLAARAAGLPQVTTAHGFIGGTRRGRVYEWLQVWVARRAAAAVAVSGPIVERYAEAGVARERIHLIPNAWAGAAPLDRDQARQALGLDPEAPLIGWVGRLSAEKAPADFIRALGHIGQLSWEAAIIGNGPERPALEALARAEGIADRVRWLGLVPEAGRAMGGFDAYVLSSRTEGTPIALLEAMAAGVPTVATAVGGVPDVISEREGWLVPPGAPDRLGDALADLLGHPEGAARRGRAARERLVQERDAGPWLARHEALYRSLLDRTEPG